VSHEDISSFVEEANKFLATPADEINLQQSQEMRFDFIEHFKSLGNSILSLFKQKEDSKSQADLGEKDDDPVQIEIKDTQKANTSSLKKDSTKLTKASQVKSRANDIV